MHAYNNAKLIDDGADGLDGFTTYVEWCKIQTAMMEVISTRIVKSMLYPYL